MKKVMCYLPNSHIVIWYLSTEQKFEWLIHLEDCSIMWLNKTHSADMSWVVEWWEDWIERLEPLNKHVYINAMHLNMHYMWDKAIINPVWKTHNDYLLWLDNRFIFQADKLNLSDLSNWYIDMLDNIKKINQYTWGKWLWLWIYNTSNHWNKGTFSTMNLIFISWYIN